MKTFLQRFGGVVRGVLHGSDRLRFRGSKRQLCHVAGMMSWLGHVRGHGLIAKIAKTHRYQLTDTGRSTVTALLAARRADTQQLLQAI